MIIGNFTYEPASDTYTGDINTLTSQRSNVIIRPVEKTVDKEPDYRVVAGMNGNTVEFGAGWKKRGGRENKEYLSVALDCPALNGAINAALFLSSDGEPAQLVWNRTKRAPAKKK